MQISTHILLVSSLFWFLRDLGVHVLLTIYNSWQKQMEEAWMADFLLHPRPCSRKGSEVGVGLHLIKSSSW